MEDQILTPHFRLSEFTRSATAKRHHINNTIPSSLIPNLLTLCLEVLEPLREYAGKPIIITSGYRCSELNSLVGGVTNSEHQFGLAADIYSSNEHDLLRWWSWLKCTYPQHQILFEKSNNKRWIHIGYKGK